MADEEENECCPLCMEELDITDKTFNACPCGYQIKNEYNALCPACRAPYSELSKQKSPLDREDVIRRTKQRKQKEKSERRTASQSKIPTVNRRNLANVRVMQRNLVYIIGLPQSVADDDILRSNECFGQYGKIVKAVVNKAHLNSDRSNATASAYITFANKDDALSCIIAVDGYYLEGSLLRASFGTTKYCNFFLRSMSCNNPDCLYLHELGEQDDSFTKDEMQSALHSGKAAFRDLNASDIRAGSRFPPPPKALAGAQQQRPAVVAGAAAADAMSAAAAASNASADRQAQSAAAIHKLRQTNGAAGGSSGGGGGAHHDLRRGNSYSRIVTGFASSSSSSDGDSSSPPPSPARATSPRPPALDSSEDFPPPSLDDRKPNLRVDTSVGGLGHCRGHSAGASAAASNVESVVGPLEALKLATGSTSQEPAWAMPFPSPAVALHHEPDEALGGGPDPDFGPFGLGFDHGLRSTGNSMQSHHEPDPWGGPSSSMSPMRDTSANDAPLTASFPAAASGFPIGLNGGSRRSSVSCGSELSSLSFASIDAIFSQRNESSEALAGLLGVQLAPAPPPAATVPLVPSSPLVSNTPKNTRSSRFAFANQPVSHQRELHDPPVLSRGPPPMSSGLPPASPYRSLNRYSSFRDTAAPQQLSSMFPSASDPRAFPPLNSNAPTPPPPLPPSSSHMFARSTSDPFPATGFGDLGDSNGLAFLQQMLPNVNISYGGDFPSPTPGASNSQETGWGGLGSAALSSNAGGAISNGSGSVPYYDPALVSAPGLTNFYGLGEDDRHLRQQSAFGGFRQ